MTTVETKLASCTAFVKFLPPFLSMIGSLSPYVKRTGHRFATSSFDVSLATTAQILSP